MSVELKPLITPCALDVVLDKEGAPGWIARVRAALSTGSGQAVRMELRVGADNSIEARALLTSDPWQPIMLPGGGTRFTDRATAGQVLGMILEEHCTSADAPERTLNL